MLKDLYSLQDIADEMGVTYVTVLRWKNLGYFRTIQIGGAYRVTKEEFVRLKSEGNLGGTHSSSTHLNGG